MFGEVRLSLPKLVQTCAVCNEDFDQFWHEEEEQWKLRNAVEIGEGDAVRIVHPACQADSSTLMPVGHAESVRAVSDGVIWQLLQMDDATVEHVPESFAIDGASVGETSTSIFG